MTSPTPPLLQLKHLDHLWFQVTGTVCNYSCAHCFISCHPKNHEFGFLSLDEITRRLEESKPLGVKEYYYTGGEPFLHPRMTEILIKTLEYGPATVLTNASVLKDEWLQRLRAAEEASTYSLEFRVSLDGFTAESNDAIRGAGTFHRTLRGVQQLAAWDFLPIITAARTWNIEDEPAVVAGFVQLLREVGYERPRLKILPTLQLGAEVQRTCGYAGDQRVTSAMLHDYDFDQLICHHSRIVTDRGVHVCPILIEAPDSLLGQTLAEAQRPYALAHGACSTCYQYGAICSNPSASVGKGEYGGAR